MKTWITSDLHFSHKNIATFCPATRPWTDVNTMNEDMIQMWNDKVSKDDLVYILGDVAFGQASEAIKIVKRLNGTKILIEGNHDRKNLKDVHFRNCFQEIHKYLELNHNGTLVVMCHFPFLEWNQMHRGAVNFFGHIHGKPTGMEKYRSRDMGFDATGKIVVLLDDAIADALKGEIKEHH